MRRNRMVMTKRLAVLALALLPVGASAQGVPRTIALPGVRAQPAGITVQGHGTSRIAVKTLQFFAMTRGNAEEGPVLAAMRAAGIVDPSVGPAGSSISSNQPAMLRGTIPGATHEKLDRIAKAAADYLHQHPGASIDNVNFVPRIDDCDAVEQTARTAAFADARRRAQAIASLAGLSIDGVEAVNETGGCPVVSDAQPFGQNVPFDLGTLSATISVFDTITFSTTPVVPGARRHTL